MMDFTIENGLLFAQILGAVVFVFTVVMLVGFFRKLKNF